MNPLQGLVANPLLMMGAQMMSNSAPGPSYRPAMMGVPQVGMNALQAGYQAELMQRQKEEYERQKAERAKLDEFTAGIQQRAQDPYVSAGGPLPATTKGWGQELLASGVPGLQTSGINMITKPAPTVKVGPGENVYTQGPGGYTKTLTGGPPLQHQPLPQDVLDQKKELAVAGRGQTNVYSGDAGKISAITGNPDIPQDRKKAMIDAVINKTINEGRSAGQVALDKKVADEYVQWTTTGAADTVKQMSQLTEVLTKLQEGEQLTGPQVALMPKFIRDFVHPDASAAQENVEEVVQRSLRAILGAQFTEKEGERLIARAWNPRLSPEINRRRVARLLLQMQTMAEGKMSMFEQFMASGGTMSGSSYEQPTVADFDAMLDQIDIDSGNYTDLSGDDAAIGAGYNQLQPGDLYRVNGGPIRRR